MRMVTITPNITAGLHTRTRYNAATRKIELAPNPMVSTYPGDWSYTGAAPTISGDAASIQNTDASDRYLWLIYKVEQTVASPITLRVIAQGLGIQSPASNGFSIWIYGSYAPEGGTNDVQAQTQFPAGTWTEQQFSATINPAQPVQWVYLWVFARNKTGTLTVRNLEVCQDSDAVAKDGEWISDTIDIYAQINAPITPTASDLAPTNIGFYYGAPDNVDNLGSVEHSQRVLSQFQLAVLREPGELNSRQMTVINYLISQGVKVFGYTASTSTDAVIQAAMDRCAAAGYAGAFFDEAGYDWGVSRGRLNSLVTYAHGKGLPVMANAWTPSDVLGSQVNETYNPNGSPTALTTGDWVLLESFYSRGDDLYAGQPDGGFAVAMDKYTSTVSLAGTLGVKVAGLAYYRTNTALTDTSDRDNSYLLAVMLGLDGWAYGSTTSNRLTRTTFPAFGVGATYAGALRRVGPMRWERDVTGGTLWFEAVDNPVSRSAGRFATRDSYNYFQTDVSGSLTADRSILTWETTASRSAVWTEWDGRPSRYVRLRATLTNA